jgi:hypothetical protein
MDSPWGEQGMGAALAYASGCCASQSKWTVKQYMCSKSCKGKGVGRQQREVVETRMRAMMPGVLNGAGLQGEEATTVWSGDAGRQVCWMPREHRSDGAGQLWSGLAMLQGVEGIG